MKQLTPVEKFRFMCSSDNAQVGLSGGCKVSPVKITVQKDDWIEFSGGYSHTIGIKNHGELWAWGNNNYGQLGLGDNAVRIVPIRVDKSTDWTRIQAGYTHTMATKGDTLMVWGSNRFGQLGTRMSSSVPMRLTNDFIRYSCGYNFSAVINKKNMLMVCGRNNYGQLGLNKGSGIPSLPLETSSSFVQWKDVKVDQQTNWGNNSYGVLGSNSSFDELTRVTIDDEYNYYHLDDEEYNEYDDYDFWSDVICGGEHAMGYWKDKLLVWGRNQYGQLGLGHTRTMSDPVHLDFSSLSFRTISCGYNHTLAISSGGYLYACGNNDNGQLGMTGGHRSLFTQIGTDSDWDLISAGYYYSFARKTDGTLWYWGKNGYGLLGVQIEEPPLRPEPNNYYGRQEILPKMIEGSGWEVVRCGSYHTIGIRNNTLMAWGNNAYGELDETNIGDSVFTPVPAPAIPCLDRRDGKGEWIELSNGFYHTIGLKHNEEDESKIELWACGNNDNGMMGETLCSESKLIKLQKDTDWHNTKCYLLGKDEERDLIVPDVGCGSVSCDYYTNTISTKSGGQLQIWGFTDSLNSSCKADTPGAFPALTGSFGGCGDVACGCYPVTKTKKVDDDVFVFGATTDKEFPPTAGVDTTDWKEISAGCFTHIFTIQYMGDLWAWGKNESGQLGLGDTVNRDKPARVGDKHNWLKLNCKGRSHSMVINKDGELWVCGNNSKGQLGLGTLDRSLILSMINSDIDWKLVDCAMDHSVMIKNNGSIWCCGFNAKLLNIDAIYITDYTKIRESKKWISISQTFF